MCFTLRSNLLRETSSVLRISGADAYTYLQGQFTQDLSRPPGSVAYGLWLNQRGKVLADSFVLRTGANEFITAGFSCGAGVLRERLESYIVADEVELVDETDAWARIQLWSDGAEAALAAVVGSAPQAGHTRRHESGFVFPGSATAGWFEVLVPQGKADAVSAALVSAGARPADRAQAERDRILAGVPAVPDDIGSADLPNEAGLEATAISFTKGCYLGQEVMARLKNLGHVRRRLHVVRGPGAAPAPRTPLHQGGRRIGETRSMAETENGFVAMAMLALLHLDPAANLAAGPVGAADIAVLRRVGSENE